MRKEEAVSDQPIATRRAEGRGFPIVARKLNDDEIYQRIYTAILEHHLPPRTRLPEDSLGDIFGVSRTRIRKVLHRLAHEKIISLLPNRGAVVASPSSSEARDIFAARRVVEAGTTGAAATAATASQVKQLARLVMQERTAHESRDHRTAIRLSGEFHIRLAEIAGNPVLTEFLRGLVSRTSLIIAVHEAPGRSACNWQQHEELVNYVGSGEGAAAVAAMEHHLLGVEASLNLDQPQRQRVDLRRVLLGTAAAR